MGREWLLLALRIAVPVLLYLFLWLSLSRFLRDYSTLYKSPSPGRTPGRLLTRPDRPRPAWGEEGEEDGENEASYVPPVAVFTDFDGTVTLFDLNDCLFDHCRGREARLADEEAYLLGEMDFREVMSRQFEGINMTLEEGEALLRGRGPVVDPHFPAFVEWCRDNDVPLAIVSSGGDLMIKRQLEMAGVVEDGLEIYANRLRVEGSRWLVEFRDGSSSGNDKRTPLRRARRRGYHVVYVGDGHGDYDAATYADTVIAKEGSWLARTLREGGGDCKGAVHTFCTFRDVQEIIAGLM